MHAFHAAQSSGASDSVVRSGGLDLDPDLEISDLAELEIYEDLIVLELFWIFPHVLSTSNGDSDLKGLK